MKKIYLTLLAGWLLMIGQYSHAQKDSSGIYITAEDFQNRKLSYAINYKTEKHKIRDNILFNNDKIVVKHKGETYTLVKSETYGYRNTKGIVFRFIDNKEYKVLNPGESLLLYFYQHPAHTGKDVNRGLYQPEYYFSKDANAVLQPLTKANLKAAFPDNHRFHDELDAQLKTDKDLYTYDRFHKTYKINWILKNYNN